MSIDVTDYVHCLGAFCNRDPHPVPERKMSEEERKAFDGFPPPVQNALRDEGLVYEQLDHSKFSLGDTLSGGFAWKVISNLDNYTAWYLRPQRIISQRGGDVTAKSKEQPAVVVGESSDKEYRPESKTAKQRLLDIKNSGKPWTSKRDMANRIDLAATTVCKAVSDDPDLSEWKDEGKTRQSVNAEQMSEAHERNLSEPDFTDEVVLPEEREAVAKKAAQYAKDKHPQISDEILTKLGEQLDRLAELEDPMSAIDFFAKSIKEERRTEYQTKLHEENMERSPNGGMVI